MVVVRVQSKHLLICCVILTIIAGLVGAQMFRSSAKPTADRIRVSGNIELEQMEVAFKVAGRLVERTVTEGDAVTKGMIVARLDRDQLLRQREREQAALAAAEALLQQSLTGIEFQRRTSQADVELRHAEVSAAEARLRQLQSGARSQEVEEASQAVAGARAEFERAEKDLERAKKLRTADDISAAQYDSYRTRHESAQAGLRQALERLALIKEGPRKEAVEASQAEVSRAKAGLKAGEAGELDVKRREQEIAVRRAEIDRARAQIALIDTQLSEVVVTSPINGVVLVKSAEVGEILAPGSPVLSIGDMEHPWLRAYIGAPDLGKVKIGARVLVTTDSYPGKAYEGRVSFIASEAEFTPKQIQTTEERVKLVYRIKIDIRNPNQELKSNMPADADILISK